MIVYAATYVGAVLLALIATPLTVRIARSRSVLDHPGVRRVHSRAVPRLGGAALFVSVVIPVTVLYLLDTEFSRGLADPVANVRRIHMLALLATCSVVFAAGLIDDLASIGAGAKLLAQVAAAAIACAMGVRIDFIAVGGRMIEFGWWAWPITILWIVAITNAVNLIDGLDGLAAGISLIACGVMLVLAVYTQNVAMTVMMSSLLGGLTGFLFFNFNPARIFLGDCGSMFLGYFLAVASVMCSMKSAALVGLALPAAALGLPIFDTMFSMLRRALERRSMFAADRKHIHHHLIDRGLNQRHAVIVMYAITALAACIGMLMIVVRNAGGLALILIGALLPSLLVFRAVGAIRFRQAFSIFQQNRSLARDASKRRRDSEEIRLRLAEAETPAEWSDILHTAAVEMGFAAMRLRLEEPDRPPRQLTWSLIEESQAPPDAMMRAVFPLDSRTGGQSLCVEVDIPVDEALESIGVTLSLLGRLLDECDISRLRELARSDRDDSDPEGDPE